MPNDGKNKLVIQFIEVSKCDEKSAKYAVDVLVDILAKWHIHDIITLLSDWRKNET